MESLKASPGKPVGVLPDWRVAAFAAAALGLATVALAGTYGLQQGVFFLLGAAIGLVLYHATFGFASSWRHLLSEGRGEGLRAQMLMLALATLIFFPLLDQGSFMGRPLGGAIAPVGVSVLVGACLFGAGMQLGGACASGTLYSLGGGSPRMMVVLIFFMIGSVLGSAHLPWWLEAPSFGSISLLPTLGLWPALALQLSVFLAIFGLTLAVEHRLGLRKKDPLGLPLGLGPNGARRLLSGPWPLFAGAIALALLNAATLVLAGHPWTISFGYTLWGAKLATGLGVDVASWQFWTWSYPQQALAGSVFENTTSLMNFGIIAGAFLAAGLAGRFRPGWRMPWSLVLAAAFGGFLMGYGARLAFGCNIGAYFSGIASGSLHGWLWLGSAIVGTYIGLLLRPLFGLTSAGPFRR